MHLLAIDHQFRGTIAGVVVGTHDKAVGTSRANRQQVASLETQMTVLAQEVSGFTDRTDQIPGFLLAALMRPDRNDRLTLKIS